jgi:hypothetical protein
VAVDAAAHALLLGVHDWCRVGFGASFEDAQVTEELRQAATHAVLSLATRLQHRRDRALAIMTGNAVNGARSVDGRGSSNGSTSSTRG